MNIKKKYVEQDSNADKNSFTKFLQDNKIKSILFSDGSFIPVLRNGELTDYGSTLLNICGAVEVEQEELEEFLLTNTATVQDLLNLKGNEMMYASRATMRSEFVQQCFKSVSDSVISDFMDTTEYRITQPTEIGLLKEYKELSTSSIMKITRNMNTDVVEFLFILCEFIAVVVNMLIQNSSIFSLFIGLGLGMLLFIVIVIVLGITISLAEFKIRELKDKYKDYTYGIVIDSFVERPDNLLEERWKQL